MTSIPLDLITVDQYAQYARLMSRTVVNHQLQARLFLSMIGEMNAAVYVHGMSRDDALRRWDAKWQAVVQEVGEDILFFDGFLRGLAYYLPSWYDVLMNG